MSEDFVSKGLACVGWDTKDTPTLHNMLNHIKTGDIIHIKAHPPQLGLIINAVGVVTGNKIVSDKKLGNGVQVRWEWHGEERLGKIEDKYPVRNLTLYEEFNPDIQKRVIELLLQR